MKVLTSFLLSFMLLAVGLDSSHMSLYNKNPSEVTSAFETLGWQFEYAPEEQMSSYYKKVYNTDTVPEDLSVQGATIFEDKTIYLINSSKGASTALNHEVGHFVDYCYAVSGTGTLFSETSDFNKIYEKEAKTSKIFDEYAVSTATEYFATAYKNYVENNSTLKKDYPNTYTMVDSCLLVIGETDWSNYSSGSSSSNESDNSEESTEIISDSIPEGYVDSLVEIVSWEVKSNGDVDITYRNNNGLSFDEIIKYFIKLLNTPAEDS